VYQTSILCKMRQGDLSTAGGGPEFNQQIFRLQWLVSYLLEKNEELRKRLATQGDPRL